jgi:hypothetical protein
MKWPAARLGLVLALIVLVGGALAWWYSLPRDSGLSIDNASTSVLANDTAALPSSAQAILHNFYEADKEEDRQRLGTLFTPDVALSDIAAHESLFSSSTPATFNSSNGYVVLDTVADGNGWLLTVRENRVDKGGSSLDTRLIQLLLVPSQPAPWAVERYSLIGSTGKYGGFLVE